MCADAIPNNPEVSLSHAQARLTVHGRVELIHRVVEQGRPVAHVIKELKSPAPPATSETGGGGRKDSGATSPPTALNGGTEVSGLHHREDPRPKLQVSVASTNMA